MATTEKSLNELLEQLSTKSLEDTHYQWTQEPIESFPSYTISNGGTSDPSYGAVPNVVIGGGITMGTVPNVTTGSTISGTSGAFWTVGTGTSATPVWQTTNPYTAMGTGTTQPGGTVSCKKVTLAGDDADVDINGKSLKAWMEKVEERLNILTPNPELEKEWNQLRRLGERYRKLEKKCKEQSAMWKKLKTMPKPDIT